jgi:hypothetical protein
MVTTKARDAHGRPDATDDARLQAAVRTTAASLTGSVPEPR